MTNTEQILEFNKIKQKLIEYSYTQKAKEDFRLLKPYLEEMKVRTSLRETTQAKYMIEKCGNPPAVTLNEIDELIEMAQKGDCLSAVQLESVMSTLTGIKRLKDYLNRAKQYDISLAYYEENLDFLSEYLEELHLKIRNSRVDSYASKLLKDLRSEIENTDASMHDKANSIMKANKDCMSDSFSTLRNGHICLPVKKEYKHKINGTVMDKSSTGNTLFIEPSSISQYYEILQSLKLDEENEERRILYYLTSILADNAEIILFDTKTIEKLDFIFAKAKLSLEIDGIEPDINTKHYIKLVNARHALMDKNINVPLNFEIGNDINGIIITGPNTGGKTVAIKTVALNCLLAQSGLHVPCQQADICMNNAVLCDIGDGQNISENLSTFSAHITNVLDILKRANQNSLVIMDELGSGTDPTEGMGIAVAVLEELKKSGALYLVTTHYPEIKKYAEKEKNVINARMNFDRETLKPLYQLVIGEAGESCALHIAKNLGMPDYMLKRASLAAYGTTENDFISSLSENNSLQHEKAACIKKIKPVSNIQTLSEKFHRGDSVIIFPDKKIGIVCEPVNEKGVLRVQLQDKKIWINHKRVKLKAAASQLYPENYDFSIIFEDTQTRKAKHQMSRKYCEDLEIHYEE